MLKGQFSMVENLVHISVVYYQINELFYQLLVEGMSPITTPKIQSECE